MRSLAIVLLVAPAWCAAQPTLDIEPYRAAAARIADAALADSAAWERTAYIGDTFGHRLSGSASLEALWDRGSHGRISAVLVIAGLIAFGLARYRGYFLTHTFLAGLP